MKLSIFRENKEYITGERRKAKCIKFPLYLLILWIEILDAGERTNENISDVNSMYDSLERSSDQKWWIVNKTMVSEKVIESCSPACKKILKERRKHSETA
jgi:hypothetical protein